MKLTVTQIEAFSTVMTVGTATGAASILNTSQPSITRSLKQLEDATCLKLFDRVRGRLVPTSAAYDLVETVERTFNGLTHIRQAAEAIRKREMGHIRIACLPALSQGFIARAVADLRDSHPDVAVSIQTLKSQNIHKAVQSRFIDIGIAAYDIEDHGLVTSRFTTIDEIVALRSDHPLAQHTVISPEDLNQQNLILLAAEDPYRDRLETLLSENNVYLSKNYEVETSAGACALVLEGLGIVVLNPLTAMDYVQGNLVIRKFSISLPFVTSLITAPTSERTPLIDSCVRVLEGEHKNVGGVFENRH